LPFNPQSAICNLKSKEGRMHFWDSLNFGHVNFLGLPAVALGLIALALFFDFLNGFHDAANSVATVVSTRVLSPQAAVIWAAFFNFVAFLIFSLAVAETMSFGVIDYNAVRANAYAVIAATLTAACLWDLLTWYYGLPTSSSHALVGGLVGAALACTGSADSLEWSGIGKTLLFIVLAPLIGFAVGLTAAVAVTWLFRRSTPRQVDKLFRRGQLLSAALYSLGHGGNDAQKTMGIILVVLLTAGASVAREGTHPLIPTEVVLACHTAMGLGTLFGGWRIVKTMGQRLIKLSPVDGFCAETGAAGTLMLTIVWGIPVSTTHTITGAIVGVGTARYRVRSVRWAVAGRVVWAWILTIPGSAVIAAGSYLILDLLGRTVF
jgi:PiT family inorganic phosphate transporter